MSNGTWRSRWNGLRGVLLFRTVATVEKNLQIATLENKLEMECA